MEATKLLSQFQQCGTSVVLSSSLLPGSHRSRNLSISKVVRTLLDPLSTSRTMLVSLPESTRMTPSKMWPSWEVVSRHMTVSTRWLPMERLSISSFERRVTVRVTWYPRTCISDPSDVCPKCSWQPDYLHSSPRSFGVTQTDSAW